MSRTIKQIIPGNSEWCIFYFLQDEVTKKNITWNWAVIPAWGLVEHTDGGETWTDVEPLINMWGGHDYNTVDEDVGGTIVCHVSEVIDTFSADEIYTICKDHRGLRKWLDKYESNQG